MHTHTIDDRTARSVLRRRLTALQAGMRAALRALRADKQKR